MKSLLKRLLLDNWPRKALSLVLAIMTWFFVNQSLTTTKTISNIGVRIVNIPPGKTIEGIQSNGLLSRRINLTLTGSKTLLEDLNANDFEVVIDASNQRQEWIATISKKNLFPLNAELNLAQGINKISHKNFIVKLTKLVTEKIPIIITQPIGEAPKGYQFIDIWPYQLHITVSGPEEVVKKLKTRGLKLTFNLSDISKAQLDEIRESSNKKEKDTVTFFVPNHWKQISLPVLSSTPIEINDSNAKYLRIDFIRHELIPLKNPTPIGLYFPPPYSGQLNPAKITISQNSLVTMRNGLKTFAKPLYAKGVSELFLEIMRDMIEVVVIVKPKKPIWSIQMINHRALEDRYVSTLMSDVSDEEIRNLQPTVREEYLRNRFRSFMNHFRFYLDEEKPLNLKIDLTGNSITLTEAVVHD
ncbi:MAG: hypothetical protein SP1CHLAM54_09140 [Chlamydiia bacterium]|nr:hypothetical protein [Chlamydiia bacterium]MCH9615820.1 hypothetical protein [Chlamydiia bacterium]MCH9628777.1 hypothetical protein [Chlamydiia bacterium]